MDDGRCCSRLGRSVDGCDRAAPGGAGCAQGAGDRVRAVARRRTGARAQDVREFKTTVGGLLVLRDWLKAHGVTQVAMEATGVYWKPVWAVLEDELRAACWSTPVTSSKFPVARPTSRMPSGCASCLRRGCCGASFVPPKPIRAAAQLDPLSQGADQGAPARGQPAAQGARGHRDQARLRRDRHPRRLGPGDARRARARARPTPRCWPSWRKGRLRAKIPALREALEGRFDAQHALLIGAILAHLDFLDEQIERLSDAIEEQLRPFRAGG